MNGAFKRGSAGASYGCAIPRPVGPNHGRRSAKSLPKILAGALLAGSLVVVGALAGPAAVKTQLDGFQLASSDEARDDDHDCDGNEYGRTAEGDALGLRDLTQQLSEKGYGEIRKIEREGRRYEVKARDRDGRCRELKVDARTGRILAEEDDD